MSDVAIAIPAFLCGFSVACFFAWGLWEWRDRKKRSV